MQLIKQMVYTAVIGASLLGMATANAGGYFGAPNKTTYEGWACSPAHPNYAGWVHIWRDDGKFIGALPANLQRESAVGAACGDAGVHGFSGTLSIPNDYLDNQTHVVRAYFINPDNTVFELQNSVSVLFDGGPVTPPPPPVQTVCGPINQSGWVNTYYGQSPMSYCYKPPSSEQTSEYQYTYIPNMPVGSEVHVCDLRGIPAGWTNVSQYTGRNCQFQVERIWRDSTVYVIKKMQ